MRGTKRGWAICELGAFKSCTKTCHKRSELAKLFKTFGPFGVPAKARWTVSLRRFRVKHSKWAVADADMSVRPEAKRVCLKKWANLGTPSSLKGVILSVGNWSFWSPFFCGNSRIRSYNGHGQFRWFAIDANMTPCAFSRFMISPES